MRLLDPKFKGHRWKYIIQSLIATTTLVIVLIYMDIYVQSVTVASIGATSFIIFTLPHRNSSKVRYILGGYTVGILVGVLCHILLEISQGSLTSVVAATAVGLAMLIMVVTNTEHPPAAALAMGIAIEGYTLPMLIFVYFVAVFLLAVKWILRRWLIDLL